MIHLFCDLIFLLIKLYLQISQKPEGLTIYAKLDFNENLISESSKITVTTSDTPDLNFTASLPINANDPICIDDLAYKPVIGN